MIEENTKKNFSGFSRHYVPTDEGKISYLRRIGDGPTVVLIPGSFSDAEQWMDVVSLLPKTMPLVLAELCGHGGSWPPPANGSIEQFAVDILSITGDAQLERFIIGGHSIGGMVALEVGRIAPEHVLAIISFEGWTCRQAAYDAFPGNVATPPSPEKEALRNAERARVTAQWTPEQIQSFGSIWRQWDGTAFLNSTQIPLWEVYGDRGRQRPERTLLRIPDRPNIRLRWIQGASHDLPRECPDLVAKIILEVSEYVGKNIP
ncbi:MAG TPA: alpha/beta hydrolase [Candidatus Hydrogenedentes bacterium]|nr:alpha/beta hydrolase [Candidatus Hydrogenedentota bacterium]HPO85885.1 alpha/beta hydrolase [Candidatus Hydrogenedentota bacterium]